MIAQAVPTSGEVPSSARTKNEKRDNRSTLTAPMLALRDHQPPDGAAAQGNTPRHKAADEGGNYWLYRSTATAPKIEDDWSPTSPHSLNIARTEPADDMEIQQGKEDDARSNADSLYDASPRDDSADEFVDVTAAIDTLFSDDDDWSPPGVRRRNRRHRTLTPRDDPGIDGKPVSRQGLQRANLEQLPERIAALKQRLAGCKRMLVDPTLYDATLGVQSVKLGGAGRLGAQSNELLGPSAFERPRRVTRDSSLGDDGMSIKEIRDAEDAACNAGLRNPAIVCQRWPKLVRAMAPVRKALLEAIDGIDELRDLPLCAGPRPSKKPPGSNAVEAARSLVAKALKVRQPDINRRHSTGKWRASLIEAVQVEADDLDTPLAKWLVEGSPMGFTETITPGGLFPLGSSPAEADTLDGLLWEGGNHGSFEEVYEGSSVPPGIGTLHGYFEKGYASRYPSRAAAIAVHGDIVVSPLGNVAKLKAD